MYTISDFGLIGKINSKKIVLSNENATVAILTYGATLQSFEAFGTDIVVGSEVPSAFFESSSFMGQVVGPVANRVRKSSFTLNGKVHRLENNDHGNCLHSGHANYGIKEWRVESHTDESVTLAVSSLKDEGDFPGLSNVSVTYTLKDTELTLDYTFTSTEDAPVNITNHAFFNLNGTNSDIRDHELFIASDEYVDVDELLIPTKTVSVKGTPFDFTSFKKIGERRGGAYDNCFLFGSEKKGTLTNGVLALDFATDLPGVQLYTGEFLDIKDGKNGMVGAFGGLALETEYMPDGINIPGSPSLVVKAGDVWKSRTSYKVRKA
jgi:Galactose mutarotase and related enzymes